MNIYDKQYSKYSEVLNSYDWQYFEEIKIGLSNTLNSFDNLSKQINESNNWTDIVQSRLNSILSKLVENLTTLKEETINNLDAFKKSCLTLVEYLNKMRSLEMEYNKQALELKKAKNALANEQQLGPEMNNVHVIDNYNNEISLLSAKLDKISNEFLKYQQLADEYINIVKSISFVKKVPCFVSAPPKTNEEPPVSNLQMLSDFDEENHTFLYVDENGVINKIYANDRNLSNLVVKMRNKIEQSRIAYENMSPSEQQVNQEQYQNNLREMIFQLTNLSRVNPNGISSNVYEDIVSLSNYASELLHN